MYRLATIRPAGSKTRAVRGIILRPRAGLGETQCNVDPMTGGRVCRDVFVPGAAQTTAAGSTATTSAIAPRPSRSSRFFPGLTVDQAQAMVNAAAGPAQVAASTPTVTATDAMTSLSNSVSSALASLNLSGSTLVSFLPNWAVILGVGAAGYYLTHRRPTRGRYR